jgi:hypothetical protein
LRVDCGFAEDCLPRRLKDEEDNEAEKIELDYQA